MYRSDFEQVNFGIYVHGIGGGFFGGGSDVIVQSCHVKNKSHANKLGYNCVLITGKVNMKPTEFTDFDNAIKIAEDFLKDSNNQP